MKEEPINVPNENVEKLGNLIRGVRIAMLTTVDANQRFHSCPMATQETEFEGDLWFFARRSSQKCLNIQQNQKVNIVYSSPKDQLYVSVVGSAQLVEDMAKARELWSPTYKAWFEKGLQDPELVLIKVAVEDVEYWEHPTSAMMVLTDSAKSLFTGKVAPKPGEHEKIHLQ